MLDNYLRQNRQTLNLGIVEGCAGPVFRTMSLKWPIQYRRVFIARYRGLSFPNVK